MYDNYMNLLDKFENGDKESKPFDILVDLHGLISGFKACSTWEGEKFSEILK